MIKQDEFERLKAWAVRMERLRLDHEEVASAIKTQIRYTVEKYNEISDQQDKEIWSAVEDVLQKP